MTTQLENEVRGAMAARASVLPSGAVARVRAADYRPRRRRAPATAGVLAGAATAGTVIAVVVGGGAPAAYAGWSATPTSAPAPSPAAAASCQNQLSSSRAAPPDAGLGSGAWQNVLTDVRGPFTVALFQNDGAYAACFTSSFFTEVNQISSGGAAGASSGSVSVQSGGVANSASGVNGAIHKGRTSVVMDGTSSGDLQHVVQTQLSTTADGPYTLVDGQAASGVTGVTLVRDDGQDVVATVSDGWIVAWWPGSATATSAQVSKASGTVSEQLEPLSMPSGGSGPSLRSGGPLSGSGTTGSSGNSGTGTSATGNSGRGGAGSAGYGG